jgi:hypothetical protein
MNKWNALLAAFDRVYGFGDQKKSAFRKVSQSYDERTNELVVLIEYRVRRGTRRDKLAGRILNRDKNLLQHVNALAKAAQEKSVRTQPGT